MTKTIRFEVGENEWFELYDPSDQTHRKVVAAIKQLQGFKVGETPDEEMDQWLRDRVAAWHLVDPDTNTVMDDPQKDDLAGLKKGTLKLLMEKFAELTANTVPFASGS